MAIDKFDCIVIGAGMAGASAAAEIAEAGLSVLLCEAETQPGQHSTGRSAALFTTSYGPPPVRALSRASHAFFAAGHPELDHALLRPRGALFVAPPGREAAAEQLADDLGPGVQRLNSDGARALFPLLRPRAVACAIFDPSASDVEVASLHALYLRRLTAAGGRLQTRAEARTIRRDGGIWAVDTPAGRFLAPILVNAAGAWADGVATRAGVPTLGLEPRRRTALLVDPPAGTDPRAWPMAIDIDEQWYVKPDAGRLLLSPADATPSVPCDAHPEEIDIAIAIDRVQHALDLPVQRIVQKWAGLRSFLPDGVPVAGFDDGAPGFFWLAGQGGYGIQTAPALARCTAALVTSRPLPPDILAEGLTPSTLAPSRLRTA